MIRLFELYKIGLGPSSSHTVGPMVAAGRFLQALQQAVPLNTVNQLQIDLYGSLSLTGRGHHTDIAVLLGLNGYQSESVPLDEIPLIIERIHQQNQLHLNRQQLIHFDPNRDVIFHSNYLPRHENGLRFRAFKDKQLLLECTYYSIGGGFVVSDDAFTQTKPDIDVPYPFTDAESLLALCAEDKITISQLVRRNEQSFSAETDVDGKLYGLWEVMQACMQRGMQRDGALPGPLQVPRRAKALKEQLENNPTLAEDPMNVLDWVNLFAFAVNEENAAGGRVVTAPTNGACGVVPAVLAYYQHFIGPVNYAMAVDYLATAGAIGILFKRNASISGAEVGCQGEVGVACSMAAAGLSALRGANPEQICMAAEIAMEHHLGLTCDPVAGQVQVPCIERNGMAAVKAINASRMAMQRTSSPLVSLDKVIETMYETGKDMPAKYRETSLGGLAIKVLC